MLISRYVTLFLVPVGVFMSTRNMLPLTLAESISGAIFGYCFLLIVSKVFKYLRNVDGIGEGDFDLLLFIGSFTGIMGCWMSITIGSILGSLCGIISLIFMQYNENHEHSMLTTKIPFGPFLAIGALIFTFMQKQIFHYFLIN